MGHQLTIEGEEAFALATELASLTGESLGHAVIAALRERVETERRRQAYVEKAKELCGEFRATLTGPLPTSDHAFLYDDKTGLPV